MREDRPSSTAAMVAAARAEIHRSPTLRDFDDPYAEALLPAWYGVEDERALRRTFARGVRRLSRTAAHLIALRTVAIDEAIRTAPEFEQFVILGAGLDARPWRLPLLQDKDVFEVDHPATQAYKRERAGTFDAPFGRHSYVDVDFERQSLDERLEESGHRVDARTVWVWEGVTMYLHPQAVEQTVAVLSRRSAVGSRIAVTYVRPSVSRSLVGIATAVFSERLRASYVPVSMAALMKGGGFEVISDTDACDWHARWGLDQTPLLPGFSSLERLAVVDRV